LPGNKLERSGCRRGHIRLRGTHRLHPALPLEEVLDAFLREATLCCRVQLAAVSSPALRRGGSRRSCRCGRCHPWPAYPLQVTKRSVTYRKPRRTRVPELARHVAPAGPCTVSGFGILVWNMCSRAYAVCGFKTFLQPELQIAHARAIRNVPENLMSLGDIAKDSCIGKSQCGYREYSAITRQ